MPTSYLIKVNFNWTITGLAECVQNISYMWLDADFFNMNGISQNTSADNAWLKYNLHHSSYMFAVVVEATHIKAQPSTKKRQQIPHVYKIFSGSLWIFHLLLILFFAVPLWWHPSSNTKMHSKLGFLCVNLPTPTARLSFMRISNRSRFWHISR